MGLAGSQAVSGARPLKREVRRGCRPGRRAQKSSSKSS